MMKKRTIKKLLITILLFVSFGILWYRIPFAINQLKNDTEFFILTVFIYHCIRLSLIPLLLFFFISIWAAKSKRGNTYNLILLLALFSIWSYPVGYGIINFGKQLATVEGVSLGSIDGWLEFTGSILGGVITLLALLITLNHEKMKASDERLLRLEEAEYHNPPILIYDLDKEHYFEDGESKYIQRNFSENEYSSDYFTLKEYGLLVNDSDASITSLEICKITLFEYHLFVDGLFHNKSQAMKMLCSADVITCDFNIDEILPKGRSKKFSYTFKAPTSLIQKKDSDLIQAKIQIECQYSSTLTTSTKKLVAEVDITLEEFNKYSSDNQIAYYTVHEKVTSVDNTHRIVKA